MFSGSVMVTALESSSAERPGTTVNAAATNMAAGKMRRMVSIEAPLLPAHNATLGPCAPFPNTHNGTSSLCAPSDSSYRSYLTREFHVCNLLAACALAAYGQMNAGEISGAVKDQLGGLLPGATI